MRVIRSVAVICGNCERAFQLVAPSRTASTPDAEQALLATLMDHARGRGWRYHEYLEEDHCPRCARKFMAA